MHYIKKLVYSSSIDSNIKFYLKSDLITPDVHKPMYKDGNKLGMRKRIEFSEYYINIITKRIDDTYTGEVEYLEMDYLSNLIANNKNNRLNKIETRYQQLLTMQKILAKYNKKLPKSKKKELADLLRLIEKEN